MSGAVGVLALQGDFARHASVVESLGHRTVEVRQPQQLGEVSALILPGGESTTISMGLEREGLVDPIREFAASNRPVFGTCAGMVLLGRNHLGLIDIEVERNAYGRQIHSFETDIEIDELEGDPVRALFIRAPRVIAMGDSVEVVASFEDHPVFVRQGNVSAISFHPELVGESRIHELALGLSVATG